MIRFLVWILALGSCLGTLFAIGGRWDWRLDLFAHFVFFYAWIQLACLLVFFLSRKWMSGLLVAVFFCWNAVHIVPLFLPQSDPTSHLQKTFDILLLNTNSANQRYDDVLNLVRERSPHLFALLEVNDAWVNQMNLTLSDYPYRKVVARPDNFGIALYSRIALDDVDVYFHPPANVPSLAVRYQWNDSLINLMVTHPIPPMSRWAFGARNAQFKQLAQRQKERQRPGQKGNENWIVLGDFNITSWSYHYKHLLKTMNLRNAHLGFGWNPTWPTMLPLAAIQIDHVFISDTLNVVDYTVERHVGSDHWPIFVRLALEENKE